ncbi:hypothetical protein DM860_013281 [Cuscuta australis]|uniref:RBR-type E3 ubiquitin transferase n=1 Tax=Cuscuta australis TaxID=267555 RepID=A0A328DPC8_9ASTE|nr:hypothetical protein DM860_013281 [Cuscuta australis]
MDSDGFDGDEYDDRASSEDDDCDYDSGSDSHENADAGIPRAPSCKVITRDSLLAAQKEDLQRVKDLLLIKEHHARTLLIHYRWDVDKVVAIFVEKGKERLYAEVGVTVECNCAPSVSGSAANMTCKICYDDIPLAEATTMDCGHSFCNDCWAGHFTVQINAGKSKQIQCMEYKCNAICDEVKVKNLVGERDPDLAWKFERFLLESYIEDNKMVKWCPSIPHCGNAIYVDTNECCDVECECGLQFCFSCSSETHSPCSCLMWELWMKKCSDDSETVNYKAVYTKDCPKCKKPVEKNEGCNLVRCMCGQPFCWLCGGATGLAHTWDSIEGHTCGRYKENYKEKIVNAKKQLLRYTHYFNRYKAHIDSLKAEANLKQKLQERVSKLESGIAASMDFKWVTNALNRLFQSRHILAHSYPFAYYMFGDALAENKMTLREKEIKQHLFEDHQQQLETNTERLSMYLEQPIDEFAVNKVAEMRLKITALSLVINNFCRKLYECIENDLLIHLPSNHTVAPYRSTGAVKVKASELAGDV